MKPKSVTLTLIDQGWPGHEFFDWRDREMQRFTQETGIRVEFLPSPETAVQQVTLWRKLLESRSSTPDVYAIDGIWPGLFADHLIDLNPYLGRDLAAYFPAFVKANTVNGRLVAAPFRAGAGMLFYRTDLLAKYGYRSPPASWDELETMAARIQAGERSEGKKDFWGYVWQGAPSEALTCNALEWQVSEGGGQIIEDDHAISVNNPNTIRAWEQAARWIGSISPPSVVRYLEWDSFNVWLSGHAAFMRNWTLPYVVGQSGKSAIRNKFAITVLPHGRAGHAGTLGTTAYGVSRYSPHRREAVELVRYYLRRDVQLRRALASSGPPAILDLYKDPEVLKANPYFAELKRLYLTGVAIRPASVTGSQYPDISRAYSDAVHSVLIGEKSAPAAAADLEKQLVQITGLPTRAPATTSFVLPRQVTTIDSMFALLQK